MVYNNIIKTAMNSICCRFANRYTKGCETMDTDYLKSLENYSSFTRKELSFAISEYGLNISDSMLKVVIKKLLESHEIARVGRNAYCVINNSIKEYCYHYSELSCEVAEIVSNNFPYLDFTIFELVQLNAFLNHQIAHNVVFISVEGDLCDFVFDKLKERYPGKVLINPTNEIYNQYWCDDMIVVERLVSEAPRGIDKKWHTRIEKLLVDIYTDPIQKETFSASELPTIYEDAFAGYIIDESCMFRYAKRRGIENKLKKYILKNTDVKFRKG